MRPLPARRGRLLRATALGLALLAMQTGLSGCFGRFALTRKLYSVNESINDKWLRSILLFVLVAVPVYGVCAFVDWAFFNTIEFWGGTNPVDGLNSDHPPAPPAAPPAVITTASDGGRIQLELSQDGGGDGDVLRVEWSQPGAAPRVLRLSMNGSNATLRDGSGALISSLRTDANGGARVLDANGIQLDAKSAFDRAQLEAALRVSGRALLSELEFQRGQRVARR